jgi:sugar phosphate isomerase/epimerase
MQVVEVGLDDVEVTVVGSVMTGGMSPLEMSVDIAGGDVERADDGVERVVDALDHFLEVALMAGRVGTCRELAVDGGAASMVGIGDHALHACLDCFHALRQLADFVPAVDSRG